MPATPFLTNRTLTVSVVQDFASLFSMNFCSLGDSGGKLSTKFGQVEVGIQPTLCKRYETGRNLQEKVDLMCCISCI